MNICRIRSGQDETDIRSSKLRKLGTDRRYVIALVSVIELESRE
jgi:hypothetical protein